jgi:hypothetical protein
MTDSGTYPPSLLVKGTPGESGREPDGRAGPISMFAADGLGFTAAMARRGGFD